MRSHRLKVLLFLLPAALVAVPAFGADCAPQSIAALRGLTSGPTNSQVTKYRAALVSGSAPSCMTGSCSLLSAELKDFLHARGLSDARVDGVDAITMMKDGHAIAVPRMHRFLRDTSTGTEIIIDPTYLQFLGGAAHPPGLPETFVGTKAELQALFAHYAEHFTPFPGLDFTGPENYGTHEFVESVYGDHAPAHEVALTARAPENQRLSAGKDLTGAAVYLNAHGKPVFADGRPVKDFWTASVRVIAGGGQSKRFYDGGVLEMETIEYPDRIEKIFHNLDGTTEKKVEPK